LEVAEVDDLLCVNLGRAPATLADGYALGREIAAIPDAPPTGTRGWGNWARLKQNGTGSPWGAVGNNNVDLVIVSELMLESTLYDPTMLNEHGMTLPMATLSHLAGAGPTHDLIGHPIGGDGRGAFEWTPWKELPVAPAQKSMWAAEAGSQVRIAAVPTHGGTVVSRGLARRSVTQRSNWFISRNLRWTSQAIAFAHTESEVHGGQAWNAMQNLKDEVGRCLALWNNSVFGGIIRNAYGQSSQAGRARIQVKAIPGLPCPDFGADTAAGEHARWVAGLNFAALSELELEPFAYCFRDENRWRIDDVVAEMIGLDVEDRRVREMLAHYRLMFAGEPNVNGRNRAILAALEEVNPLRLATPAPSGPHSSGFPPARE
jgi:hypothetical protein